jgi:hypothetical protein
LLVAGNIYLSRLLPLRLPMLILLLTGCATSTTTSPIVYQLTVNQNDPSSASLTVNTRDITNLKVQQSRKLPSKKGAQAAVVSCVDNNGNQLPIRYNRPIECQALKWNIKFINVSGQNYLASKQNNIYSDNGWWLFIEWGNLPRIVNATQAQLCISETKRCLPLPTRRQGPLMLAWGEASMLHQSMATTFRFFIDDKQILSQSPSLPYKLKTQYDYLEQVTQTSDKQTEKNIDVVWVGIDKKFGSIGGAAGDNIYVANYPIESGKLQANDMEKLLWVSAHELFHFVSPYNFPAWMTESLAHYYGYKSLNLINLTARSPLDEWREKSTTLPHASIGLYPAYKQVELKGDWSYYPLFYVKGTAFWQELDTRLADHGNTLDNFLHLLSGSDRKSGKINPSFEAEMHELIGDIEYQRLVATYLQ